MTKGQRLTDEEVAEIVSEVKHNAGTKKSIAERHGIHPTMISKILQRTNGKVKAPKRKTARKPVDKMEQLKAEFKKNQARQQAIKSEMTKLFFERMLEEE